MTLPGQSRSRAATLHLADPPVDGQLVHLAYCGRWVRDVFYWATPELERTPDFLSYIPRCKVCAGSRRNRDMVLDVAS